MSDRVEDMQFYEWLFGRRATPFVFNDRALVPFPLNYGTPIEVQYDEKEHKILVGIRMSEERKDEIAHDSEQDEE